MGRSAAATTSVRATTAAATARAVGWLSAAAGRSCSRRPASRGVGSTAASTGLRPRRAAALPTRLTRRVEPVRRHRRAPCGLWGAAAAGRTLRCAAASADWLGAAPRRATAARTSAGVATASTAAGCATGTCRLAL
jgi:hypothetical protein